MLSQFWEKMGEGLSARWLEYLFSPALLFWGGGALILAGRLGFAEAWGELSHLDVPAQTSMAADRTAIDQVMRLASENR